MVPTDDTVVVSRLFLYVPPLGGPLVTWNGLRDRLAQEPECANDEFQHWPPRSRDHVGVWTRGRIDRHASSLAARLAECDEAATARGRPYDEIILLGSSIGALLVRWAWLDGMGAFTGNEPEAWAAKVRRIVLFGGLNRGFSTRLDPARRTFRLLVTKLLISLVSPIRFAWQDALAGSAFVTNVRLTWMRYIAQHPDRQPEVVQLLGSEDDLVNREDSRDIEQFPQAAHVSIAGASHFGVLDVSGPTGDDRYLVLRSHILHATPPTTPPPAPQAAATDVVFVVHGIRAGAYGWVTEIRRLLTATGTGWRVVTPTYRYFSALAFAFPVTRWRKVRWFLDQYSRELAGHPSANFHFVGHSNGTYLLGQALQQVPAVRFERVYLAGSVLPGDYPWHAHLDRRRGRSRIAVIRSDRGNRDLPVAVLAQGLRGLRMRDVGDGGFGGFAQLDAPPAIQWPYFPGGHAAPLSTSDRRRDIARYITTGTAVEPEGLIDSAGGVLALVSRLSPVLIVAATVLVAAAMGWALVAPGTISVSAAALVVLAVTALAFV
jgi:alpha-beta hydrolase superfamily lysophospholipase